MCGLVGLVTKAQNGFFSTETNVFRELLYIDALRGWDSTGITSFHNTGELRGMKKAVAAPAFIDDKLYQEYEKTLLKDGKAVLGHNRKSTVGKTNDETAHPFFIDNRYAFIHNGTLRDHKKLHDTEVDSEALAMHLVECEGDVAALEHALSKVDGAYACMWIDQKMEKMYMLRNFERPLFYAETAHGYVVSSEAGFLAAVCSRHNMKVEDIKQVPAETLITIDLNDYFIKKTEQKLTVKKAPPLPGTTVATKAANGACATTSGKVSKNTFKRIRAKTIGTFQCFWMDDYNARVLNDPKSTEWLVWGTEENEWDFPHKFEGVLKDITEEELVWTFDTLPCYGIVDDVVFNNGSVTFKVKAIQQMKPSSTIKKQLQVQH